MADELANQVDAFKAFVSEHLNGCDAVTLEEGLARFRRYQQELASARAKLREAEEQSARGESTLLDADALKSAIRERLAGEGITD